MHHSTIRIGGCRGNAPCQEQPSIQEQACFAVQRTPRPAGTGLATRARAHSDLILYAQLTAVSLPAATAAPGGRQPDLGAFAASMGSASVDQVPLGPIANPPDGEMSYPEMLALCRRAVVGGATLRPGTQTWEWDISSRCLNPPGFSKTGWSRDVDRSGNSLRLWLEAKVRCRRCVNCRQLSQWEWTARAVTETLSSVRTYLVTLTLSPEEQYLATAEASAKLRGEGLALESLPDEEQFAHRCGVIGIWITRYIKRCRFEMGGSPLRYILVAEAHKSGDPHFHMLVHELSRYTDDAWDTYCVLKSQWTHGHADIVGVDKTDKKCARYVCKYITKSVLARVRASTRYGRDLIEIPSPGPREGSKTL